MKQNEKYHNMQGIVSDDFLKIVGVILDSVQHRSYEHMQDNLVSLFCKDYLLQKDMILITDKNIIYRSIWKEIIDTLYNIYLPSENNEFDWSIELTPHSFFLWLTAGKELNYVEVDKLLKKYNITEEYLESNFESCLKAMHLDDCDLAIDDFEMIPSSLELSTRREQLAFFFNIMNIPPLENLYIFFNSYCVLIQTQLTSLNQILKNNGKKVSLDLDIPAILNNAYHYFDHHLFIENTWDDIFANKCFDKYRDIISEIEKTSLQYKDKFKDNFICPCCGEENKILIPDDAIKIKLLLDNRLLYRFLGIVYFDRYVSRFMSTVIENIKDFDNIINSTSHPDCLIMVEGESEEIFLSIAAQRLNINLIDYKIKIFNSKSKQKLLSDFISLKEKYPKLKIVCLLDSDAVKEKDSIERVIRKKLNKYRLVYIKKGAFEDLFDTKISLDIINELYPNGDLITKENLDQSKEFAKTIDKALFNIKQEKFDKVKFAKKIAFKIDIENIPKELRKVLELSVLLAKGSKYLM
ncbi:hypothetical protein NE897_04055 [Yersinia ruckeri]|uniref:TOPRIM nucleotidyl transferase/hydrolase domain-containing protein n=1 Tax=Yersinia ruckeri TaxID=29486 RepID=UPI00223830F8|nr:TOPRIM nucleotidyl transferase/hydrolase domain-containing protein [Yersinia ruckeri]MCW6544883.1 hypothetical protein [Yersinia ruckeri]MCW6572842.1 hypothetical protein [Yersinia ruckeri]